MSVVVRAFLSQAPAQPPTEFQIFKAGVNGSTKGSFLFDAQAAADVMAAYRREGVDLMVDLEHASLSDEAMAKRSDSADARAWFKLEVRNGGLFAVEVRWTPDGARRLSEKTQRYISPAFTVDKETGRVKRLINAGLVSMPATLGASPLVAASRYGRGSSTVISARIENPHAEKLHKAAQSMGMTSGALLRCLVKIATDRASSRGEALAGLGTMFGLVDGAGEEAVYEVARSLPEDDSFQLSKAERQAINAKGWTLAEFIVRRSLVTHNPARVAALTKRPPLTVATLSQAQRDRCRQLRISPEAFVTQFNALRR